MLFSSIKRYLLLATCGLGFATNWVRAGEFDAFIDYDPATGNLAVDHVGEHRTRALSIESLSSAFNPVAMNWLSPYDVSSNDKRFVLALEGIDEFDFGPIGPIAADPLVLAEDLCVTGARLTGGDVGEFALRIGEYRWRTSCSHAGLPPASAAPTLKPERARNVGEPLILDYEPSNGSLRVDARGRPTSGFTLIHEGRPFQPWRDRPEVFLAENLPDTLTVWSIEPFETMTLGRVIHPGTSPKELADSLCFNEQGRSGKGDHAVVRSGGEMFLTNCVQSGNRQPLEVEEVLDYIIDPDAQLGIIIDDEDRSVIVHVPSTSGGASKALSRIEIKSETEIFRPGFQTEGVLDGVSDVLTTNRLLKIQPEGFGTVGFGPILIPDVDVNSVEGFFDVSALFTDGTSVEAIDVVHWKVVPEPNYANWIVMVPVVVLAIRRFRH